MIKLEKKKKSCYTIDMIKVGTPLDKDIFYEFRVNYFNALLKQLIPPENQKEVIQRLIDDGYISK